VGAETLRRLPGDLPAAILRLRKVIKTRDTFLKGHILGHHVGGVIHCNYNQTRGDNELGTGTGRLSVNDPALQQIHKRDPELASVVRACFLPDKGQAWCSADWDQKEFRWFAHFAKNPTILEMYRKDPNTDFHAAVAELTGLPRSNTPGIKGNAKQINLGLVFGMGMGRLALEMGLPYEERQGRRGKSYLVPGVEAEQVFEKYHRAVPGVKQLLADVDAVASSRGWIETVGGRHIRFPRGGTHKAAGLLFQGSSADCMKQKMVELDKEFAGTDTELLLSVHDENDFTMDPKNVEAKDKIKEILECFDGKGGYQCRVPIKCSVNVAENWWEASK